MCALLLVMTSGAGARADESTEPVPRPADEMIIIIEDAPDHAARDRARDLRDAPFVTVRRADEHGPTASVADALATSAGVQMRSLGGLGAYQSISVRGVDPGHTAVLVDGIPLARITSVTTDLGRFALDGFGEVELYRGAVPLELGGAGVGGAVNLVTRVGRGDRGERVRASLGAGSFGARHLRARAGDDHDGFRSALSLGVQSATGDFEFFDDNGTALNHADDRYRARTHNAFAQVDGAARVESTSRTRAAGVRASWKRHDLPGTTTQPAMAAVLGALDVIADARADVAVGAARAHQLAYAVVGTQHVEDPDGELGLGRTDRAYLTLSGGATSTWKIPVASHRFVASGELRGDRFRDRDETGTRSTGIGTRFGAAVSGGADLSPARQIAVTAGARLDLVRTAPTPAADSMIVDEDLSTRWDVVPSPRVAVRATLGEDLALKGSTGWYVRLPTLVEVFGNRGYLLGSPGLRAETGPSSDVGIVWAPARAHGPIDRIVVSASAFGSRARDTIAIAAFAAYAARAVNIGRTQAYGAELVTAARFGRTVSVTASYTRLVTEQISVDPNLDGNPIPRRPGHQLYARADVRRRVLGREVGAWADVAVQGTSTLDAAALARVPVRALVGAGGRLEIVPRLGLSIAIANLTDERVIDIPLDPPPSPSLTEAPTALSDVAGFPLPGRSLYLTLDWSH